MEKLIIEMEKYRRENLTMTDKEIQELKNLSNEMNILIKHSGEKITIAKDVFSSYFNLFNLYKEIEGFNHAINYIEAFNKESKE